MNGKEGFMLFIYKYLLYVYSLMSHGISDKDQQNHVCLLDQMFPCASVFGSLCSLLVSSLLSGLSSASKIRMLCYKFVLIDVLLTVKAAALIFISGRGSAISSAKQRKSGSIFNLVMNKLVGLGHANVRAFHENPNRIHTELTFINP